ncbi:MAG: hypothetical protein EAY75_11965 [Bacteroidetes bacterium]|nr:MAG: hypothetical protein EAY75_11965 [Bacteroidota bacterium]
MKGNKKKPNADVEITGLVIEKTFGEGSKSQHLGIFLETIAGDSLKLRRMGGNPFNDPELKKLLGKTVVVCGVAQTGLFIAKSIKPTK